MALSLASHDPSSFHAHWAAESNFSYQALSRGQRKKDFYLDPAQGVGGTGSWRLVWIPTGKSNTSQGLSKSSLDSEPRAQPQSIREPLKVATFPWGAGERRGRRQAVVAKPC